MSKPHNTTREAQRVPEHARQCVYVFSHEALSLEYQPLMLHISSAHANGERHFHSESQRGTNAGYPRLRYRDVVHRLSIETLSHDMMCEREEKTGHEREQDDQWSSPALLRSRGSARWCWHDTALFQSVGPRGRHVCS